MDPRVKPEGDAQHLLFHASGLGFSHTKNGHVQLAGVPGKAR